MRRPFNGPVNITQEYGNPDSSARRGYHTGNDYGLNVGTPVIAPINGVIIRNGDGTADSDGRGYFLVFKGDDGVFHQLFHLRELGSKQGRVNEGDELGVYTGNTGKSTGPHLHWETTTRDDRTSDFHPASWLFARAPEPVDSAPAPTTQTQEYVAITGDYRSFYASPGGKVTTKLLPNNYGGTLTYAVLEHSGNYVKIQRQDGSGTGWIYCGADVAYLTTFYRA